MWRSGEHCVKITKSINDELLELKGTLDDEEAKITFAKFLAHNPTFAAQILLGMELYPIQHLMLKAMALKDFGAFVLSRGFGKCIQEDSLVMTDRGLLKIKDVQVGDEILAEKKPQAVFDKIENPAQDGLEIVTHKGSKFAGIINHRTLVFDSKTFSTDYKHIEELKVGDYVVGKVGGNLWGASTLPRPADLDFSRISEREISYYCGLILGDGHISSKGKNLITFSSGDEDALEFVKNFYSKLGVNYYRGQIKAENCFEIRATSKPLFDYVLSLGLSPVLAHDKVIPQLFLSSTKENIGYLLKGLFDTDGYVTKDNQIVGFSSNSYEMIKQVKNLLYNMGIWATLQLKFKGGLRKFPSGESHCRPAWELTITNAADLKIFAKYISFKIERKRVILKKLIENTIDFGRQILIPFGADYLKQKYDLPLNAKHLSEKRAKELLDKVDAEDKAFIEHVLSHGLVFEEIKSISKTHVKTYDVTVDEESCYVGEGIIHHNTYTAAIFAAMYALFNPGVKVGILAPSFRQSKFIFKHIEDFANSKKGAFFKQCVKKINKGPDAWEMIIGDSNPSRIFSLPLADGGRIRGYRFNLILIDEALLLSEQIVNEVIRPFLNVYIDPINRQKYKEATQDLIAKGELTEEEARKNAFPNQKLICLSSASYTFEYLYKMIQDYEQKILTSKEKIGDQEISHVVFQLSYKMAPEGLLSQQNIAEAKSSMSAAQFGREYEAQFTDDAASFFAPRRMREATLGSDESPSTLIRGRDGREYVLAIDPNYSDSETSDHFAMCLLELDNESRTAVMVHGYALAKSNLVARAKYIKYLFDNFNIVYVIVDNAGGPKFIEDINQLPQLGGREIVFHIAEFDEPDDIKATKKDYSLANLKIAHSQVFKSDWIRVANEHLQTCIEKKKLLFANETLSEKNFDLQKGMKINIDDIHYDNLDDVDRDLDEDSKKKSKLAGFIEHQGYLISLTKTECAVIEVGTSPQGRQTFDLPSNLKNINTPDKPRKDSYSALLLANWGAKCYWAIMDCQEKRSAFTPITFS
jgi:intein/homing endonuclease